MLRIFDNMNRHFLDSSVVQPMLLGTKAYQNYLAEQFVDGKIYISKYVQMEVKRSCIVPMIDFYFVLDMPSIQSIGDAMSMWSNKFSGREIKAVLRLMAKIIDTHNLRVSESRDKPIALRRLGSVIKRIEAELRRKFLDIGVNTTRCTRAQISFVDTEGGLQSLADQLRDFITRFGDVDACRNQCRIDDFLLDRFQQQVKQAISQAESLSNRKSSQNKGFVEISNNLNKIVEQGERACSCRMCGSIGDAVITFETPRNMRLDHTDYAFDQLCTIVNQPHYRHLSESEIHKRANQPSSSSSKENV